MESKPIFGLQIKEDNMKIEYLTDDTVRIRPDEGKKLIYDLDGKEHSEAIVDKGEIRLFREEEK